MYLALEVSYLYLSNACRVVQALQNWCCGIWIHCSRKALIGKINTLMWFCCMKKKNLMENKRNNEVWRPHTHWNPKRHISMVNLLLCDCMMLHLPSRLANIVSETVSEAVRWNFKFLWIQYPVIWRCSLVLSTSIDVRWTSTILERWFLSHKMSLGWYFEVAFLAAGNYRTIWYGLPLSKGNHHVLPPNWHFSLSTNMKGTQRRTLLSPWRKHCT